MKICAERQKLLDCDGHAIVMGGPGSGKTTIALKKALVRIERGLEPGQSVLFLSFSRAAVARILQASRLQLSRENRLLLNVQTFHSFFWELLKTHSYLLGSPRTIRILMPQDERVRNGGIKIDKEPKKWAEWLKERESLYLSEGLIAFDLFAPKTATPHEILGHRLADLVFQGLADSSKPAGIRAAFKLAKDILDEEPDYDLPDPNVGVLGWLHSLVDGQVDVDRADYLLRDARALGFEFAGYNLDQLIDNLVLVKHPTLGFITAIDEKGLVALESFFLSRARSNQVLTRHHKSAQIGAAFRFASMMALRTERASSFLLELESILNQASDGKVARALLEAFSRHDDPWWLEAMREAKPDPGQELLVAARGVILERQPLLRSIWKRKGDLSDRERTEINALAARETVDLEAFERATRKLRDQHKILIAIHRFKPFAKTSDGESVILIRTRNGLRPASEMSALLRSLEDAWSDDVHMHAFTTDGNRKTASEVIRLLKRALVVRKNAAPKKRGSRTR